MKTVPQDQILTWDPFNVEPQGPQPKTLLPAQIVQDSNKQLSSYKLS